MMCKQPLYPMHHAWACFLSICFACGICEPVSAQEPTESAELSKTIANGREFLLRAVHPELNLLPEFEGHKVIWLYHDNYLAAKVLARTNPAVATKIVESIRKYGVERSGKIELLFGETELPMYRYELRDVATANGFLIRSEFTTEQVWKDVSGYADLLLFVAIAEKDSTKASEHFQNAMAMWDGRGFNDNATKHSNLYATYKLALALIASNKKDLSTPENKDTLALIRKRLIDMQSDKGGWITDYRRDGTPVGFANVETTCLAILGLESVHSSR